MAKLDGDPLAKFKVEEGLRITRLVAGTEGIFMGMFKTVPPRLLAQSRAMHLLPQTGKPVQSYRLLNGFHAMMDQMLTGVDVRPTTALRSVTVESSGMISVNGEPFDSTVVCAPS